MKILIASDSFKENMTSIEVADIIEKAFIKVDKKHEFIKLPISDGGEGFVDSLISATDGKKEFVTVKDPFGRDIKAFYGLSGDNQTAYIEMASANGLESILPKHRNPLTSTTCGTGNLIMDALNKNVKKIIIGIGGSATNDGGAGMARALGVKFLDKDGNELDGSGGSLARLFSIDDTLLDKRIKDVEFIVASDVDNPLTGSKGASKIYARQKGADDEMILLLENNLRNYANVVKDKYSVDVSSIPGSGAAGGLGAGLMVFTDAKFRKGIDVVLDENKIDELLNDVDFVITGEGRIDGQTAYGKAPVGVAERAQYKNIRTIAFCGITGEGYEAVYEKGISEVYPISTKDIPLEIAIKQGKENLFNKAQAVAIMLGVKK